MVKAQGAYIQQSQEPADSKYMRDEIEKSVPDQWRCIETVTQQVASKPLKAHYVDQDLKSILERWKLTLPAETQEGIDQYMHSSQVEDMGLKTEAVTSYFKYDRGDDDSMTDYQIVENLIMMMAVLDLPDMDDVPKLTPESLMKVPATKSSSGLVPVDPEDGARKGNKEEMKTGSVLSFDHTGLLPCMCAFKPEVIKKGKKVRSICLESEVTYLKSKKLFGKIVAVHTPVPVGATAGLSRVDGGYIKVLMNMFADHKRYHPESKWEDFLNTLEKEGLSEDDKKSWEFTLKPWSAIVSILLLLSITPDTTANLEHYVQIFSHLLAPVIKYAGDDCFMALGKTASGWYWTLLINIWRHIMGKQAVSAHVQDHGMRSKDPNCGCSVCKLDIPEVAITEEQLACMVGGSVLGDDQLRRNVFPELNAAILDEKLGTITKPPNTEKAFGRPGEESVEFLRVRFRRTGNLITTYRDRIRVFAKIFHGDCLEHPSRLHGALLSAAMELGHDEEGNQMLQELYDMCKEEFKNPGHEDLLRDELEKLAVRGEGIHVGDCNRPMSVEQVLASQFGMQKAYNITFKQWHACKNNC